MNILVRVRNRVTTSPILPDMAESGMMKLSVDANTIKIKAENAIFSYIFEWI